MSEVVNRIETLAGQPFPVLNHGLVRIVDYTGDDSMIVQAARVSYCRGTKTEREVPGPIRWLMRLRHRSPVFLSEIERHRLIYLVRPEKRLRD